MKTIAGLFMKKDKLTKEKLHANLSKRAVERDLHEKVGNGLKKVLTFIEENVNTIDGPFLFYTFGQEQEVELLVRAIEDDNISYPYLKGLNTIHSAATAIKMVLSIYEPLIPSILYGDLTEPMADYAALLQHPKRVHRGLLEFVLESLWRLVHERNVSMTVDQISRTVGMLILRRRPPSDGGENLAAPEAQVTIATFNGILHQSAPKQPSKPKVGHSLQPEGNVVPLSDRSVKVIFLNPNHRPADRQLRKALTKYGDVSDIGFKDKFAVVLFTSCESAVSCCCDLDGKALGPDYKLKYLGSKHYLEEFQQQQYEQQQLMMDEDEDLPVEQHPTEDMAAPLHPEQEHGMLRTNASPSSPASSEAAVSPPQSSSKAVESGWKTAHRTTSLVPPQTPDANQLHVITASKQKGSRPNSAASTRSHDHEVLTVEVPLHVQHANAQNLPVNSSYEGPGFLLHQESGSERTPQSTESFKRRQIKKIHVSSSPRSHETTPTHSNNNMDRFQQQAQSGFAREEVEYIDEYASPNLHLTRQSSRDSNDEPVHVSPHHQRQVPAATSQSVHQDHSQHHPQQQEHTKEVLSGEEMVQYFARKVAQSMQHTHQSHQPAQTTSDPHNQRVKALFDLAEQQYQQRIQTLEMTLQQQQDLQKQAELTHRTNEARWQHELLQRDMTIHTQNEQLQHLQAELQGMKMENSNHTARSRVLESTLTSLQAAIQLTKDRAEREALCTVLSQQKLISSLEHSRSGLQTQNQQLQQEVEELQRRCHDLTSENVALRTAPAVHERDGAQEKSLILHSPSSALSPSPSHEEKGSSEEDNHSPHALTHDHSKASLQLTELSNSNHHSSHNNEQQQQHQQEAYRNVAQTEVERYLSKLPEYQRADIGDTVSMVRAMAKRPITQTQIEDELAERGDEGEAVFAALGQQPMSYSERLLAGMSRNYRGGGAAYLQHHYNASQRMQAVRQSAPLPLSSHHHHQALSSSVAAIRSRSSERPARDEIQANSSMPEDLTAIRNYLAERKTYGEQSSSQMSYYNHLRSQLSAFDDLLPPAPAPASSRYNTSVGGGGYSSQQQGAGTQQQYSDGDLWKMYI